MEALFLVLFLAGPALLAGAVMYALRPSLVVRISTGSIATQFGLVVVAWLLLATMPGREDWGGAGDACRDFGTIQGAVVGVIGLATLVVGGIAAGSSTVSVLRGAARPGRIAAGIGADALCVAVWIPLFVMALCGLE